MKPFLVRLFATAIACGLSSCNSVGSRSGDGATAGDGLGLADAASSQADGGSADDCPGNRWEIKAPMPTGRSNAAAATFSRNGQSFLAVLGGFGGGYLATAEAYDPQTDSWATMPSMSVQRSLLGAAEVLGKIHAIAGFNGGVVELQSHEVFDPASDAWSPATALPVSLAEFAVAAAQTSTGSHIFLVGGYDEEGNDTPSNEDFSLTNSSWTARAAMPTARSDLALATLTSGSTSKLYAIGGYVSGGGGALAVNEEYDPETDSWQARAPMPTARRSPLGMTIGGRIYVFGGVVASTSQTVVEAYDPSTDTWDTSLAPMPIGKFGPSGGLVANRAYIVGGSGGDVAAHNETQVYFPPDPSCPPLTR